MVLKIFPRVWGMGISDAVFSLLINAVILRLNCLVLVLISTYIFFLLDVIFSTYCFNISLHCLELYVTDTALKVSRSLYCFTTSISHGVLNYFPNLWGTGISDTIFMSADLSVGYFSHI